MVKLPTVETFDLHRFSMNDGPGIRTTVFLKGCPLRCQWCHNPESISFKRQLSFDAKKCQSCAICVEVCPQSVHSFVNGTHQIDYDACKLCGKCVEGCPEQALKIIGKRVDVEEIIAIAVKDKDYYANSGGGLTISGGEPMSQFDFTLELLTRAREEGIHTCLDTCGIAPWEKYRQVMPFVSTFLYDYKATGDEKHRELTASDRPIIMENLDRIIKSGGRVILRCPMIPGVNDSPEHLAAIAGLERQYPELVEIQLMAWHRMGNEKGIRVGMPALIEMPDSSEEKKQEWLAALEIFGAKKCVIG